MKFVTFSVSDAPHVGVACDPDAHRVLDLSAAGLAADMTALIRNFAELKQRIESLLRDPPERFVVLTPRLLAPIPRPPRNIFCVGKNYVEHAHEFSGSGFDSSASKPSDAVPTHPIVFSKPPSSVIGPEQAIDSAMDPCQSVDYEGEIAVVIGRGGRVGASDDPMSFVFGYTVVNDVTSRELQKTHKQWLLGKGPDTFCPMGPAIVTAEAFGAPADVTLTCEVNGELRQKARMSDLIFDVPTLIRTIGTSISFEPGDVIATGTPVGVGIGFQPPRYLKAGDRVSVSVTGIGTLRNPVI